MQYEFGPECLPSIREALTALSDGVSNLCGNVDDEPVHGSPFVIELSTSRRKEPLVTARSIARILIGHGEEHIAALVKVIAEPVQPIVYLTCVRSMLEPCARAAWLLDPEIDGETRVKRQFAIRFTEMSENVKLARALNRSTDVQFFQNRIGDLERDARALGHKEIRNRKGKRIGIGVTMPQATTLIKKFLNEEVSYRILSAVSHGQTGTTLQLIYAQVSETPQTMPVSDVPVRRFDKVVDHGCIVWLSWVAARAFAKPVWDEFTYAGGDKSPLRGLLEAVFDRLDAGPTERFWQ